MRCGAGRPGQAQVEVTQRPLAANDACLSARIADERSLAALGLVDRLDDGSDLDVPVAQNVGTQAAAMDQGAQYALVGQSVEVRAWLEWPLANALSCTS